METLVYLKKKLSHFMYDFSTEVCFAQTKLLTQHKFQSELYAPNILFVCMFRSFMIYTLGYLT